MAGVYAELRGFVLAHRACHDLHDDVDSPTPEGYRLFVQCGCGAEFKRLVTQEDADADLLRSSLLAFEN